MKKLAFGLIIGKRGFFPAHLCETGQQEMIEVIKSLGHEVVCLTDGPAGLEGIEDAQRCAKLFAEHGEEISGIVVSLPNFGDERTVANAIRWSGLNVPVLVHAFPDQVDKLDIDHRRDSFCGKISVCNVLRQYGIPFSLTRSHTISPSSDEFKEDLQWFAGVCRIVKGLKNLRLGAIGTRPAAFATVRYSEKILERAGITVEPIDLSEILGRAQSLGDQDAAVLEKLASIEQYITINSGNKDSLLRMAKFGAVIDQWVKEHNLKGTAIQCWTSLEENFGITPCSIMSMLTDQLIPSACEVDITGLISMYALQLASQEASAIVDWNNNYGNDPDKVVFFHCSNYPKSLLETSEMGEHKIISRDVGRENAFGTVCGRLKSGPFTFARITTDDTSGQIRAYLGEGTMTSDPAETFGGYGVAQIPGLQDLMKYVCYNGFEHHAAIGYGNYASMVYEAFTRYLNWETYYHQE